MTASRRAKIITGLRQQTVRLSSFLSWEGVGFLFKWQYGRWDYGVERHFDSEGRLTQEHRHRYRLQVAVLRSRSRFLGPAVNDIVEGPSALRTHPLPSLRPLEFHDGSCPYAWHSAGKTEQRCDIETPSLSAAVTIWTSPRRQKKMPMGGFGRIPPPPPRIHSRHSSCQSTLPVAHRWGPGPDTLKPRDILAASQLTLEGSPRRQAVVQDRDQCGPSSMNHRSSPAPTWHFLPSSAQQAELNWTEMTVGFSLRGRPQRDWASRVERASIMPSAPYSVDIHTRSTLGRLELRKSDSSREQQQQQQVEDANGRSSRANRQVTLLHTSAFIRKLTAVLLPPPRPAAMPVPGYVVLRLLEGFHDMSS